MPKDGKLYPIELESEKVEFLEQMAREHSLPDIGKVLRCLVNYAREHPDRHGDIFGEVRCLDC